MDRHDEESGDGREQLGERLGHLTLRDESGAPVELASLWRERPVVLLFVRHFG